MARAKRTDRNEARRRYRAGQASRIIDPESGEPLAPNTLANDATAKSGAATQPVRPGLMGVFRGSFRPLDLRGDLLAAPKVLTHWALLASVAVSVVATILYITSTSELGASLDFSLSDPMAGKTIGSVSNIAYLVISLFVAPPPAAGAFLIGFTAVRASWLGGLVQGLVAGVCYAAIALSPAGRLLTGGNPPDVYIANAIVLGPIGGMLFASAAAWYRRFLNSANPNRGRRPARPAGKPKTRPAAARTSARR